MKFILCAAVVLATAQFASASLITESTASKSTVKSMTVYETATIEIDGRVTTLSNLGHGLRQKNVVFMVDVYGAQLMVDDPALFVRTSDGALDSMTKMNTVMLRMQFLRSVPAAKLEGAYMDSLEANGVDVDADAVVSFMDAVTAAGNARNNEEFLILGEVLSNGSELVHYQNGQGEVKTVEGYKGFVKDIMSIWLGKTTDKELEKLKQDIIKGA